MTEGGEGVFRTVVRSSFHPPPADQVLLLLLHVGSVLSRLTGLLWSFRFVSGVGEVTFPQISCVSEPVGPSEDRLV